MTHATSVFQPILLERTKAVYDLLADRIIVTLDVQAHDSPQGIDVWGNDGQMIQRRDSDFQHIAAEVVAYAGQQRVPES